MKTTLPLAVPSSPKTGSHSPSDRPGGPAAGADTALGFLAELAAAIGSVGPLGQPLTVPDVRTGTAGPGTKTTADALASTPTSPPGRLSPSLLDASGTVALLATARAGATLTPLPAPGNPAPPAHEPHAADTSADTSAGTWAGTASASTPAAALATAETALPQVTLGAAMPAQVTGPRQHSSDAHRAKPAGTTLADTTVVAPDSMSAAPSSTPAAAKALTPDSAAAGIDPFPAAAASTSTAVTTDDGSQQTTAVLRQVFPEVTRVASTPGTHRLSITLHPDDLGEVRVTVVVRGESVRVNVATDPTSGIARSALEHGAPELRRLLESTGANARVEFRDLGAGTGASLGSATDGGRQQQSQTFAQAQAQSGGQSDGRDGRSDDQRQPHQHVAAARTDTTGVPATSTTTTGTQPGPQIPTARTAASGLDQLI